MWVDRLCFLEFFVSFCFKTKRKRYFHFYPVWQTYVIPPGLITKNAKGFINPWRFPLSYQSIKTYV